MTQARTEFEDEYELEDEFEDELEDEDEYEDEVEGEEFLGGLANIASSLLGEGEDEAEHEWEAEDELEGEYEDEFEDELEVEFEIEGEGEDEWEVEGEEFLGGLANIASSLLGEGEDEWEDEDEDEWEVEGEWEDEAEAEAEYFFGKAWRFLKKHKNVFKKIAKVAGPMIATAVGGPAAGALARAVTSQLEGEMEAELEAELEEMATAPVTPAQAMGEYLAARAATTESEAEAEAFIGSAVTMSLTARDRRQLEALLPQLLKGATVITRILRRHPATRQGVRLVPGIMDSSVRTLARYAATGRPLRPADVGAVLGASTRRVLGDPRWQYGVTRRHARGLAHVHRRRHHHRHGRGYNRPGYRTGRTLHRRPVHTRAIAARGRVGRPRPGFVRVVTPVKVPARGGHPARTVRVVSDVKVPRGAVPAGRPASVAGRRRR
ncbi:MAG: hypothetical protein QM747_03740 [Nocardioides sp.]